MKTAIMVAYDIDRRSVYMGGGAFNASVLLTAFFEPT